MHHGIGLTMWLAKYLWRWVHLGRRCLVSPRTFIFDKPGYTSDEEFWSHLLTKFLPNHLSPRDSGLRSQRNVWKLKRRKGLETKETATIKIWIPLDLNEQRNLLRKRSKAGSKRTLRSLRKYGRELPGRFPNFKACQTLPNYVLYSVDISLYGFH